MTNEDPEEYVRENLETLVRIVEHSPDDFVRSLALAALIEYGDSGTIEKAIEQLEKARQEVGDEK